ncbi:MAG: glycosyltransferase family 4 protein, partial [Vicinamibacterales bacterium]
MSATPDASNRFPSPPDARLDTGWGTRVSEPPRRFAFAIQTPKDPQSAVYIGYRSLAAALEELGHSITIVAPSDFPVVARFSGRWTPLVYPIALASWLWAHRGQFDLVIFHSYSGWLATALTRGRPPALVMFHGVEPLYHHELRAETARSGGRLSIRYRVLQEVLMPVFLTIACRTASGVACLNRREAEYLKSRGWISRGNGHVFAHGVPPEFFLSARAARPIQTLLFVGQWLPMKGVRYLVDAAIALLGRDASLRLVCAGTLTGADAARAAFPIELRDRIRVLPRVDQSTLAQLYRESDVFIFPSLYEGFSRAIAEAMASRLPIVCTDVGVAADALRDEHSALIIPKHDADALVTAVRRLQSDAGLAERLANAAGDAAREYSLAAVSQRTMDLI